MNGTCKGISLNEYQEEAMTTAVYGNMAPVRAMLAPMELDPAEVELIVEGLRPLMGQSYASLGLAGESGEVANKVKKILRGDCTDDADYERRRTAIKEELGGVMWYIAATAKEFGFKLSDIAEYNLAELAKRNEAGTIRGDGDGQNRTNTGGNYDFSE